MECAAKGRGSPCLPGPASRRCGLCGAVAYCSPAHQVSHWSDHKEECERLEQQMKRAVVLNDFPFTFNAESARQGCDELAVRCNLLKSRGVHCKGLWKSECKCQTSIAYSSRVGDDWSLPSSLCPCSDPKKPLSILLGSWKDYYEWRLLPLHSPVSLVLHWPLTIYHCIQLAASHGLVLKFSDKLNIHYLGPDKELSQLAAFGELRALFPGVKLNMELIGPAVPGFRNGEIVHLRSYASCSEDYCPCKSTCTTSDDEERLSVIKMTLHKGFYHDIYSKSLKDSCPDLIIAPNAGVAAYPSWLPTIELINKIGVRAIFTDFCEEAAYLAARCISSITHCPPKLPVQINPFRQPMLVEDNNSLYLPCYSNCFLFGM